MTAQGVVSGAVGGFEPFFVEQYPRVFRSLILALGDPVVAEDAAQEAFARAFARWSELVVMERPGTWVFVVAVREGRRLSRRRGRKVVGIADQGSEDPAVVVSGAVDLAKRLDELPARERLAIVLRYYADLSVKEVARAMRCAEGTVKSTLHSAISRLRVSVDAHEGDQSD